MALLALAVYDTEQNDRTKYTDQCLASLSRTVDFDWHKLIVVDNASCAATKKVLAMWQTVIPYMMVIENAENVGQAKAINQAWEFAIPGQHVARLDNDITCDLVGWLDILEDCVERDPTLGICGGKRDDIPDWPLQPEGCWSKTELKPLPHEKGQSWLVVEKKWHILGACQLMNAKLFDQVGYLYQGNLKWGMEDVLMSARCELAGFYSAYCPQVTVQHLDPMDQTSAYQQWKNGTASDNFPWMDKVLAEYRSGARSIWHGPRDE